MKRSVLGNIASRLRLSTSTKASARREMKKGRKRCLNLNIAPEQVGAKTNEVVEYDHDESQPGKPLHILIPGGLVALGALAVIILVAYQTWFENQLDQSTGIILLVILAPFYIGGVFLFSYGYELYNIPRAIRLTAIIVFLTVGAVVIVAVLFFVLAGGGKMPSGSSSSKKKSTGGGSKSQARNVSSSSTSNTPRGTNLGPMVFMRWPGWTHPHA